MADQISRIKSKQPELQLKPSRKSFVLIVVLWVLVASICFVQTATCPSSVSSSAATNSEQYSFSGYTDSINYGIAGGPISNSLYYMYYLFSPYSVAVRKMDALGSQIWMASLAFLAIRKSLSVDAAEQSVYLAELTSPLVVVKLTASNGSIVSQHRL